VGYFGVVCAIDVALACISNYIPDLRDYHSAEIYDIWHSNVIPFDDDIILCFTYFPIII
tara:strand:+ start:63 stop:239 length:177 start_codon:yes stop_codon:yes gene_type:complete